MGISFISITHKTRYWHDEGAKWRDILLKTKESSHIIWTKEEDWTTNGPIAMLQPPKPKGTYLHSLFDLSYQDLMKQHHWRPLHFYCCCSLFTISLCTQPNSLFPAMKIKTSCMLLTHQLSQQMKLLKEKGSNRVRKLTNKQTVTQDSHRLNSAAIEVC